MSRRSNISAALVLVFVLSGLTDFALDYLAGNAQAIDHSSSNERPEFQRFLKSHSLPMAENFSRTKSQSECEEEMGRDPLDFTIQPESVLETKALIATLSKKYSAASFCTDPEPVFLRHRQFRI